MNKIRKSRASKVIAGFVGFATAFTMSFGTASAAMTTEEIMAAIATLQAQLASQSGTGTVATYAFAKNLKMGDTNADVMNLQKVLNMNVATEVAATGVGSKGMESSYFGAKTKAAVIKYQEMHAAVILTPLGLTKGTGFVGSSMRAQLNTMTAGTVGTVGTTVYPAGCTSAVGFSPTTGASCATGVVTTGVTNGTTVNVTLAADTPVSGTLIAGQAVADLAHFTFTNTTANEVKVTNLKFNRIGVSNDVTLANVYLYNGATRLTDSASVSSSVITFNDAGGIMTLAAGASMTVSVKADITASGTSGQIIGVSLTSATAGVTVGGAFPINGNTHTIASATMATVYWGTAAATPSTASIDPQNDYVMWQDTQVNVGTRAVWMKSIMFRQIGSVLAGDLGNFRLYVDGTMIGSAVPTLGANGYVTFDMNAAPLNVGTGTHTVKLVGDIIGGSNKTFSFSLQNPGDAVMVDSQLNQPILSAQSSAVSFSALTTGTETVNTGTLTITKNTSSLSGNVTLNGSGVVLGKFDVKAAGEPLKIENLRIAVVNNTTGTDVALRNGALFADGVQVGSTASINDTSNATLAYTQFNLGSSLVVTPGHPVVLEVRGDVYNTGATAIAAGDTIVARIVAMTSNVKRVNSLSYTDNILVDANTLTVAVGGLSGSKNQTYANQTIVAPQTAYKIGSFTVVTTDTEAINLDTLLVKLDGSTGVVAADVNNLYVKYGAKTSSIKSTVDVTSTGNTFPISENLAPNTTMTVDVYATLNSTLGTSDIVVAGLTVSGTTASSATSRTTGALTGQNISVNSGSISAAFVNDSTLATKIQVGNTSPKVASFRFTSLNDTYTVTDIALKVGSNAAAGAIRDITLKSTGMTDKIISLNGLIATSTGMTLSVPANDTNGSIVDVYLNLNSVGFNAATSSANVTVTLEGFISNASTGVRAESPADVTTNAQYVFKTIPTITNVSLPSTVLSAGTKTLSKVMISADTAGQMNWKKIVWTIAKTTGVTIGATSTMQVVDSSNNIIAGTFATSTATGVVGGLDLFGAATGGTLSFVADNEQQITTSETYSLKGTVGGTMTAGNSIATSIANPTTSALANLDAYLVVGGAAGTQTPSFVWSDRSSLSHSTLTADWANDFKVKLLPTDSQTLSI